MERAAWTEQRLDDLVQRVDSGFVRVDEGFARIDERFARVDERFAGIDERFARVEGDLRELRQTTFQLWAMTMVTMLVGFLGVVATVLVTA